MFEFFGGIVGLMLKGIGALLKGDLGVIFGMLIIYNLLPKFIKVGIKNVFRAIKISIINVFNACKWCCSKSAKVYDKAKEKHKVRVEKVEREQDKHIEEQLEPTKYSHLKKVKNQ